MKILIFTICISLHFCSFSQYLRSFQAELSRCDVSTILFRQTNSVEEYLLWSPDGNWIGFYESGRWKKQNINDVSLNTADWLGMVIGMNVSEVYDSISQNEIIDFKAKTVYGPREVITKSGTKIQLRQVGLSTQFVLNKTADSEKILWQTSMENCHSLSLSPDEKYVAYISESNGIMIYCLVQDILPKSTLLMNQAYNYCYQANYAKATKFIDKSTNISGHTPESYLLKATIELASNNNEELAINYINKAIEINNKIPQLYFSLGQIYERAKKYELSIQAYTKYTELTSSSLYGYYSIAGIYVKLKDYENACFFFREALKRHSIRAQEQIDIYCK